MAQELPPFNDELRSGVLGLIETLDIDGVPVGGFISYIVGLFWPEADKSEETWKSIKKYAEALVEGAIDKAEIERLTSRLEGLKKVASEYGKTSLTSSEKGPRLVSLLSELDTFERDYWSEKNPEKMFPLFTTFGTLMIAALAEQAFYFDKIDPKGDPDAAMHLEELHDSVAKYTDAAQDMFDRLLAWRFGLLQTSETQIADGAFSTKSKWTVTDNYGDGFSHEDSGDGSEERAEAVAADRVLWIEGDFVERLQSVLAVARLWKYIDPSVPPPVKEYRLTDERPWGGSALLGSPFADTPESLSSRITKIRLHHGSGVVLSLEIFYDGKSGGVHGDQSQGDVAELELADDEYVVGVSGRHGDHLDAIEFTTNKQRTVGGGGPGGQPYSARGHDWEGTSLFAVGGRNDDRRVTGLSLQWKHLSSMPDYVASWKRSGQPIVPSTNIHLKARAPGASDPTFVSALEETYDASSARQEYFPRHGADPVALQLRLPSGGQNLSNKDAVQIWTTESAAGSFACLGKYKGNDAYYYTATDGDPEQQWYLIKMVPSDGPVVLGEPVYLRNRDGHWHLAPDDNGYLGTSSAPYAWEVQPA
ncbi:MAG: hypothetical protein QOH12_3427 [Solirubrobacteraceae bacterium]|jgi:hypothetical protein|nr:hypothetical protein [Solirubrobacteraceae bacterium]